VVQQYLYILEYGNNDDNDDIIKSVKQEYAITQNNLRVIYKNDIFTFIKYSMLFFKKHSI
jgi:hypothetical protein